MVALFCYLDGVLKFMGAVPSIMALSKSYTGIFILLIVILPKFMGLNGVIYAQAISDLLTTLVTIPFAVSVGKNLGLKRKPADN